MENSTNHSQQTKQELKSILDKCKNISIRNDLLKKITELESNYGTPIEYIGRGQNSVVFAIKDLVLKFGRSQVIEHALCLKDIEALPFSEDRILRIIPRMDTSNITEEDVQYVYNQIRNSGLIWTDAHAANIGRLPKRGIDKSALRIIDDECIREEPKDLNAFDILECDRTDMLIREYYYQKSINPKFKLSDIKRIMKSNHNISIDPYNPLIEKYKLHLRKNELKASSAVIAQLKCELWNRKHINDNAKKRIKRFFSPDKTLKLPAQSLTTHEKSNSQDNFKKSIVFKAKQYQEDICKKEFNKIPNEIKEQDKSMER